MPNFGAQARQQLDPAFNQQISAAQSQIPAIKRLYDALFSGLDSQAEQGMLGISEDQNARGILQSSITTDREVDLADALVAERGKLSGQMGMEIGDIQSQIAGFGVDRARSVADLANALAGRHFDKQKFAFDKQIANRQFSFDKNLANRQLKQSKTLADRQYNLDMQRARGGF